MRTRYETTFLVKVTDSPYNDVWYHNKKDRTFEAKLEVIKGKKFYVIDYIHKIPAQFCEVVEIIKTVPYQKF